MQIWEKIQAVVFLELGGGEARMSKKHWHGWGYVCVEIKFPGYHVLKMYITTSMPSELEIIKVCDLIEDQEKIYPERFV